MYSMVGQGLKGESHGEVLALYHTFVHYKVFFY